MSGHSHWANIKRKKESTDQQKGKLFSKITREIILAINQSGGVTDANSNIQLRAAIDKAREVNMPKENIQRLIDRAKERSQQLVEVVYEALGPYGTSLIIQTATDNSNRTRSEVAIYLEKRKGKLVGKGAVIYLFDRCAELSLEGLDEEKALSLAQLTEALDLEQVDSLTYVYFSFNRLNAVTDILKKNGYTKAPEIIYRAKENVPLTLEQANEVRALLEGLDDLDNVQSVFINATV